MIHFFLPLRCCYQSHAISPSETEGGNDDSNFNINSPTTKRTSTLGRQISLLPISPSYREKLELNSLPFDHEDRVEFKTIIDKNGRPAPVKAFYQKEVLRKVVYKEGEPSEEVHEGTFADDLLHGEGTISWPFYRDQTKTPKGKCQTFQGRFCNGKIIEGIVLLIDGTTSKGAYDQDELLTGDGSLSFPNGGGLYGCFHEGELREGKRVYGFNKGYEEGIFNQDGKLTQGLRISQEGTIRRVSESDREVS